ncbi:MULTISPECIES: polyprenyl synthetase family protein [unclassified Streptomyces]|uniref:polyprenyl synthetase family protein n=1 Tax=unclassified Streptomyces TaxID=2593676 RepID=UPI00093E2706|nr:polyprenyl synthetase family protein [Streptomyces sp. TSRI0281]OKI40114.1 geranylgeranyl diphosphate synthase [Streptomyces sp. TSRI0281]
MTAPSLHVEPLDLAALRSRVDSVLHSFLETKTRGAADRSLPPDVPATLRDFLAAGGKRLRPLFCVLGWHAASGHGDDAAVIRTAAALEMFHAFCLIHDDIMDNSATRRGHPTVHRSIALRCGHAQLGTSAAILIGDMALAWSDELLHTANHPPHRLADLRRVIDLMRQEVIYGQYLDLMTPLGPLNDHQAALKVIQFKTAKYTVERPLHCGATLADADPRLHTALSMYALPLGEAFQLRDDILGVYGRPDTTGKPVLDDLREGKHTVLIALAAQRADAAQRALLDSLVGNPDLDPDGAARIRTILDATGARATVEDVIATRYACALTALDATPYPPAAAAALRHIAAQAVERTS